MFDGWRAYPVSDDSTVVGSLLVSDALPAPMLGRDVELLAWLPVGHADHAGHRLIVFHDGQNLFDDPPATPASGRSTRP
jgi:hypothetical protein